MELKKELKLYIEAISDLVFPKPPICIVCNKDIHQSHFMEYRKRHPFKHDAHTKKFLEKTKVDLANQMCPACFQGIEFIVEPYCQQCGRPMSSSNAYTKTQLIDCSDCVGKQHSHQFRYARAAVTYNETMQEMIHLYKYRGRRDLASSLAIILRNAFELHFSNADIDMIVPVPLHEDRLAERGFNQAIHISRRIAEKYKIPIKEILLRTEYTEKQSKKTKAQRSAPFDHVFRVATRSLEMKTILLVDDIYTTGTTVNSCATVLKNNGAKEVYALTLAR